MKKKIGIVVLTLVVLSLLIVIFDHKVFYQEELPISQALMDDAATRENDPNPICSVEFNRITNYASIMPSKGEKIEIISVGKSKNVGIDIIYKVVKLPNSDANPEGKKVGFINLFGSPVGFVASR